MASDPQSEAAWWGRVSRKGASPPQLEGEAMSNVKDIADAEAARAEAEPDEDEAQEAEEVEGAEGEPEAPPEPTPSGEPSEAQRKAFDAEAKRHANALHKLMGEDFELLVPCDECASWGYRPPGQLKTHKKFIGCDTCNGFGQVLTGSKAAGNETQPCPVCAGRGFLEEMPAAPAGQPQSNGETQQEGRYGTPAWMGNPDMTPQPYVAPPVT